MFPSVTAAPTVGSFKYRDKLLPGLKDPVQATYVIGQWTSKYKQPRGTPERRIEIERFIMYDGMNFDRHGPFSLDNKSSRHVNWRLNQTVVLRQKLTSALSLTMGGHLNMARGRWLSTTGETDQWSTLRGGLSLSASSTSLEGEAVNNEYHGVN